MLCLNIRPRSIASVTWGTPTNPTTPPGRATPIARSKEDFKPTHSATDSAPPPVICTASAIACASLIAKPRWVQEEARLAHCKLDLGNQHGFNAMAGLHDRRSNPKAP